MIKLPNGKEIDENDPCCFLFLEGRYYAYMFCVKLPPELSKYNRGADVTGLLWRQQDNEREWTYQFRFRQYKSDHAWNSGDERTWSVVKMHNKTESEADKMVQESIEIMKVTAKQFGVNDLNVDKLPIYGDCAKAMDKMNNNPPSWLHSQTQISE